LYVSQYFPPEIGAPSARVSELAREWSREGSEITILTAFPNHPTGKKLAADRGVFYRREAWGPEGARVDIRRTYILATRNAGYRRILSFVSFMLSAFITGSFLKKKFDLVIGSSPQLLVGLAAYGIARIHRVPFLFEVRDLWPESIIAVGASRNGWFIKLLTVVARFLYTRADQIIVISEGLKSEISNKYGIVASKIKVVTNGVDSIAFKPKKEFQISENQKLIVLYMGTIGMAHGLEVMLKTASLLSHDPRFQFLIVGEGAEKESIREAAKQLSNLQVLDAVSKEKVKDLYEICTIGFVCLKKNPLFLSALPSKMFEYLAMERPLLLGVAGEAGDLISKHRAGLCFSPEDPESAKLQLLKMAEDLRELQAMGKRGRELVIRHFDRRIQAMEYLEICRHLAFPTSSPPTNRTKPPFSFQYLAKPDLASPQKTDAL